MVIVTKRSVLKKRLDRTLPKLEKIIHDMMQGVRVDIVDYFIFIHPKKISIDVMNHLIKLGDNNYHQESITLAKSFEEITRGNWMVMTRYN